MIIEQNDLITCHSYQTLANYCYHASDDPSKLVPRGIFPNSSVVHVHPDELVEFFNLIQNNKENYIIISSCSDFGLFYQQEHPLFRDIIKWLEMQLLPEHGYTTINLPPRGDMKKCKITDKYSIRCHAWTHSTFNEIPKNVKKLFITNCDILDDRIVSIPFGIDPACKNILPKLSLDKKRSNNLYVNFSINTMERYRLKKYFYENPDGVTFIREPKPKEEYLEDLSSHSFVLCPPGNGIDSYRILEAVYCGAIPIVQNCRTFINFTFPILRLSNLFESVKYIQTIKKFPELLEGFSYNTAKLSYWRSQINDARKLL